MNRAEKRLSVKEKLCLCVAGKYCILDGCPVLSLQL